jgi:hypothetical protein
MASQVKKVGEVRTGEGEGGWSSLPLALAVKHEG